MKLTLCLTAGMCGGTLVWHICGVGHRTTPCASSAVTGAAGSSVLGHVHAVTGGRSFSHSGSVHVNLYVGLVLHAADGTMHGESHDESA
jgi:hypothetical protein